tara:strand:+ start:60 stop:1418 length:1359 start_codon:yes stop_codon:yes gene_type:complete
MSRILKRPMFKMGGSTGTGITSGLDKPRQNYQDAGSVNPLTQYPTDFFPPLGTREIKPNTPSLTMDDDKLTAGQELLKAFENRNTRPDLSQFLINFGLNLASATPRGNIFATAAEAAKKPADTLFKEKAAEKAFDRELDLAATKMDINERLKKEAEDRAFGRDVFLKKMDLAADSEDEFELLDPATAKELLGGAYNPNLFYQRNKKNNKVEVAGKLNKEIVKENKDLYKEGFDRKQGEADVKLVTDAEAAFSNAVKFQSTLDTLNILANTSDEELKTGAFAEFRTSLTKIGNEFGLELDYQNVPLAELLRTVGGKVAIDSLQQFKGAISNKELQFVQDINPGLSMSKEGIKLQLALLGRTNEINKKYYNEVVAPFVKANGGLRGTLDGKTFAELQNIFHQNNPVVTDDIRNQIAAVQGNIDEKYKENIVQIDGVNYIVIGGEPFKLPNQDKE